MISKIQTSSRLNYFIHSGSRHTTLSISTHQVELWASVSTHWYEYVNGIAMAITESFPLETFYNEKAIEAWESVISMDDELAQESIEAAKAVLSKPLL